ncbi:hypothetical protein AWC38_SpisGene19712 [Stylophora pistillata]|uniref:Uncharacterized protein n=1 Tax=Stylophora pistillata TaxID=50429 RepID=A0A2B4RIF7_STYPI|nr:hypothetical protein AWC38_SpisGene19712 [Stylophora pistillata]
MPLRRSTRSKRPSRQALESLVAPPPPRRRTAAPSLPSGGNDSDLPSQPAILHSVPSSQASDPTISATIPAFPPALLDQLVQHIAAEVTRQLQPASFPPASQESQVPSPTPGVFPSVPGRTAVKQLTTEVPVVGSSPAGNPSAGDQVAQVVQSLHSSLTVESQSTRAVHPQDIFTSLFESGFTSGFPPYFGGPRCSQEAPNLLSALQYPKAVSAKLSKELDAHRLPAPFSSPRFPIFRISPVGLVPKKVEVFLGIPMAPEKTVGPSTTLAFAGIELDTVLMEARLPQGKLDKCRDLLSAFLVNRAQARATFVELFRAERERHETMG